MAAGTPSGDGGRLPGRRFRRDAGDSGRHDADSGDASVDDVYGDPLGGKTADRDGLL